jgi:hypothetical protein
MRMSILIIFIILFSKLSFGQKDNNPFSKLTVDSIVFYDFGGDSGKEVITIIEKNGKLSNSVVKSAKLDKVTGENFTKLLGQKKSYGSGTASCFDPHLGVVYYSNKKPIAYVNICLSCNRLHSSLEIANQLQGKQGEGADAYYILDGMSKTFRKKINTLLIKYKFSHQLNGKSMFDK